MKKKSDKMLQEEWLKDIPLQTESTGYKPEEMIVCRKCQRNNPPTRLNCMYCGVELEFDESQSQLIKPVLRKIESYAKGYNLIYLANLEIWDEMQVSEVARMTRLEKSDLKRLSEKRKILPLARAETEKETKIVSQRLKEIGIETLILNDEKFEMEKISKRLRGLEFQEDKLIIILFNNDEVFEIKRKDIALIVIGGIFERKLEATEKYKKNGENKILETAELSNDEVLIDIYTKDNLISFRVLQKGFDFSCLGMEKQMLATENMQILISKLREYAQDAIFDNDYLKVRNNLAQIWEVEETNDSKGMNRKGFASYNRMSVTTTSNLSQFTKYSRLQFLLLNR